MYCEKCGSKNETNTEFCSSCGSKLNIELTNTEVNSKEKSTIGWGILGFVIPIVGLILFLSLKRCTYFNDTVFSFYITSFIKIFYRTIYGWKRFYLL